MKTAYNNQKARAKQRGIDFQLTYQEWIGVWINSGKLLGRGRGANEYCMARVGDQGPYAVGNVYICTNAENSAHASANGCYVGSHNRGASDEELALIFDRLAQPVSPSLLDGITTYRQAVRACWSMRTPATLIAGQLAKLAGLYAPHVSDYLNPDDKPSRRSLPAESIAAFETVCGNSLISQWLASRARLTVLEEIQASKVAA